MRKIIAAINMSLDGFCDHTAMNADAELHDYFTNLLNDAGLLVYGRTTYMLMEDYWPALLLQPSENAAMNRFAQAIDRVPKLVFSHSLKKLKWKTAQLAKNDLQTELLQRKELPGADIFIGSPGLIATLTELRMIDAYQLCIHPVIVGKGNPLFKNISDSIQLNLDKTSSFKSGIVLHHYSRKL